MILSFYFYVAVSIGQGPSFFCVFSAFNPDHTVTIMAPDLRSLLHATQIIFEFLLLNLDGSYQFIGASAFVICDHPIGSNLFVAEDAGAFISLTIRNFWCSSQQNDMTKGLELSKLVLPRVQKVFLLTCRNKTELISLSKNGC